MLLRDGTRRILLQNLTCGLQEKRNIHFPSWVKHRLWCLAFFHKRLLLAGRIAIRISDHLVCPNIYLCFFFSKILGYKFLCKNAISASRLTILFSRKNFISPSRDRVWRKLFYIVVPMRDLMRYWALSPTVYIICTAHPINFVALFHRVAIIVPSVALWVHRWILNISLNLATNSNSNSLF